MMFVFNVSLVFQGKFQDERIGEESEPKKKANARNTLNGMKENYDKSDVFSVFVVLCHVLGLSISSERETNEKRSCNKKGITWTTSTSRIMVQSAYHERNLLHAICTVSFCPSLSQQPLTLWCFHLIIEFGVALKWHIYLSIPLNLCWMRASWCFHDHNHVCSFHMNRILCRTAPNFSANFPIDKILLKHKHTRKRKETKHSKSPLERTNTEKLSTRLIFWFWLEETKRRILFQY